MCTQERDCKEAMRNFSSITGWHRFDFYFPILPVCSKVREVEVVLAGAEVPASLPVVVTALEFSWFGVVYVWEWPISEFCLRPGGGSNVCVQMYF